MTSPPEIGPSPLEGSALGQRLRKEVRGEVRLDPLGRGLYATDASIYQVFPLGVVVPRDATDVEAVLSICREAGMNAVRRGADLVEQSDLLAAVKKVRNEPPSVDNRMYT